MVEDAVFDAFYRLTNSSNQITSYVFDVVCLMWLHALHDQTSVGCRHCMASHPALSHRTRFQSVFILPRTVITASHLFVALVNVLMFLVSLNRCGRWCPRSTWTMCSLPRRRLQRM